MTFRKWLISQRHRECDVVGDLARDVAEDPIAPDGYRAMRRYIADIPNHHWNVLNSVDEAWRQYKERPKRSSRRRTDEPPSS